LKKLEGVRGTTPFLKGAQLGSQDWWWSQGSLKAKGRFRDSGLGGKGCTFLLGGIKDGTIGLRYPKAREGL